MLDYKLLEALAAVLEHGGFDAAARALHLTQSAVSQRIRTLEEQLGRPVLTRGSPPRPTAAGERLLYHAHQVAALEDELGTQLESRADQEQYCNITVALNNDSLYYWFLDAVAALLKEQRITLSLLVDDEGQTHELLRAGQVAAAVSSRPKAPHGCKSEELGVLRYVCVATPDFKRRFFAKGLTAAALQKAPYLIFDRDDTMHQEFLRRHFEMQETPAPCFAIPASAGFLRLALEGVAYGFIAELEAAPHIKAGRLKALAPRKAIERHLYWHSWYVRPPLHAALGRAVLAYARKHL